MKNNAHHLGSGQKKRNHLVSDASFVKFDSMGAKIRIGAHFFIHYVFGCVDNEGMNNRGTNSLNHLPPK